jgi:class 3 adenylate cyclase/tetratricopeptide (TPR) repeat protein
MVTCPSCGQANPDGFRLCGMCGTALAPVAQPPREERKVVTVLFADLVGFTARAEQLDPEDVQAVLSPFHARLRTELERHGGTVEKFIGDAVMALFGAPAVHEDDPERAVRAAIAIRDWIREEEADLQVRIAVNTGEVLIRLGAQTDGEGMASGDVVNTASRLQSAAPVNGILVGETTHRATRHAIEYREAEPVVAKGKAEPVHVWEALQPRARLGVDLLREVKTPLIGRERDLAALEDALARAQQQQSLQLVTLVGEPGIGKSRLVFELMQVVEGQPELIRWRQGRSLPYGEGASFWALAEMVKAEAAILETDSPQEAADKLDAAVEAAMPEEREAQWVAGHLRTLAGVGEEAELGPERRQEAFAAWRRFLEGLASERPLVLVFDDLHSADDSLLDFVDHLVDWASGVPILVLATARPELLERRSDWGGGKPNAATLTIAPLSDEETHRLLGALLEQPLLTAERQSDLLARAGGNPLYAEQYVRMLSEYDSTEEMPLPETVQGLIAARLDLLSSADKRLLQNASVVGKVFWRGAAAAIDRDDPAAIDEQLHALGRKQFVQRAQTSSVADETEYSFRHLLVRDVAYGQIPRAARAAKHRAAAAWIEGLPRPDDYAETLAHHYGEALELARAIGGETEELVARTRDALRAAGDRAYALGSVRTAREHYRAAMELWPPDSPDWARLVVSHRRGGLFPEYAPQFMVRARDALVEVGDAAYAAEAELYLFWDAWNEGRGEELRTRYERLLALADQLEPSHTKAYLLANLAIQLMLSSQLESAVETATRSLQIAERLGFDDIRAHALNTIGMCRAAKGDRDGLDQVAQSLALSLEQSNAENIVRGYKNLGSFRFNYGELEGLDDLYADAVAAAERFGDIFHLRWFAVERAMLDFLRGRWDDALDATNAFLRVVEGGEPHYMEGAAQMCRAQILLARGDVQAALDEASKAVDFGRRSGDAQVLFPALAVYVCVLVVAGKAAEARAIADELLDTVEDGTLNYWVADVAPALASLGLADEFAAKLGELGVSTPWRIAATAVLIEDYSRAIDVYGAMGAAPHQAEARLLAAEHAGGGDRRIRAELEHALAFYRSVRAEPLIREAERLLGASASAAG